MTSRTFSSPPFRVGAETFHLPAMSAADTPTANVRRAIKSFIPRLRLYRQHTPERMRDSGSDGSFSAWTCCRLVGGFPTCGVRIEARDASEGVPAGRCRAPTGSAGACGRDQTSEDRGLDGSDDDGV